MTARNVFCANCGEPVADDTQSAQRQPCPQCGSTDRNVYVKVADNIKAYDSLRAKQKDPSKKSKDKVRVDTYAGYEHSYKLNKIVEKKRTIDKNNDRYTELVTDPDTKEIIHKCNEKHSEHRGHGYAKFKKP